MYMNQWVGLVTGGIAGEFGGSITVIAVPRCITARNSFGRNHLRNEFID